MGIGLVLGATGCGGSGGQPTPARARDQLILSGGTAPTSAQCGFTEMGVTGRRSRGRTAGYPRPGTYRYRTRGTLVLGTENRPAHRLPATTAAVATPASRAGPLTCFGTQHAFGSGTSTVDLYVRRGGDIYAVGIGFNTPSEVKTVLPRPAILALSATATAWSGRFGGSTTGDYAFTIIGQRTFRVGASRVPAVGIRSRASFHGSVTGSRTATTWLSTRGSLIVAETGTIRIEVGVAVDRLTYTTRLISPRPS